MKTALVTGAAGFIGFYTSQALLAAGWRVVGLDAMTDYYDVKLKERRLAILNQNAEFHFKHDRLEAPGVVMSLFETHKPDVVIHLGGHAGVRQSLTNPRAYLEANIVGTFELLEAGRAFPPQHMLLASTSSAYGANTAMPYKEADKVDAQMSFYAATKKSTENMAHSYAHLYKLPITMFRFFTVYGPWGRPDMAPFKFTKAILEGEPIDIYNHGDMKRDFTFIDDLTAAIVALIDAVPNPDAPVAGDSISPVAPHRVVNIGNGMPVALMDFIAAIEQACGVEAIKTYHGMQPGDVPATWADTTLLQTLTGQRPMTPIITGIAAFVGWYRDYYDV